MISFKAIPIHPVDITQFDKNSNPKNIKANFVEVIPRNDIFTISRTSKIWQYEYNNKVSLASTILCDIMEDYKIPTAESEYKYYAITTQMDGVSELKDDCIIALAEIKQMTSKKHELAVLQTRPRDKFSSPCRKYAGAGAALVKSIIKLFPKKDLLTMPLAEARNFYLKLGFETQILSRYLRYYAR